MAPARGLTLQEDRLGAPSPIALAIQVQYNKLIPLHTSSASLLIVPVVAVAFNNRYLVIFGGKTSGANAVLNDLWVTFHQICLVFAIPHCSLLVVV